MANQLQSMYANATVPCSVIVIPDSTHNNSVKKAADGTVVPSGVATNAARTRPDPDFSQTTQAQQVAAIAGEYLGVYTNGATGVDLYCNATWAAGDLIMADASSFGIVATSGNYYVGRAQTAGVVGALCPIDVFVGYKV